MSIPRVLARSRAAFERRMRASCVIERVESVAADPLTGEDIPTYAQVYPDPSWPEGHRHKQGPCYTRYPGLAFEQNPSTGGVSLSVTRLVLRIPHGPEINSGDRVTITGDPDNPKMVGSVLRVASNDDMSQATAQRLLCEDWQVGL